MPLSVCETINPNNISNKQKLKSRMKPLNSIIQNDNRKHSKDCTQHIHCDTNTTNFNQYSNYIVDIKVTQA